MERICSRNMRSLFFISVFLSGALGFAQKTSTVQAKPKSQHTSSVQTDPAGKKKEYMSIEEYEMEFNRGTLEVFTTVEQAAEFPGGIDSLNAFVKNNIKYPEKEKLEKKGGKCEVKFIIHSDGSISDAKIEKGITSCSACTQEALRLVLSMPKWKPAKNGGNVVSIYYTLPIAFEP